MNTPENNDAKAIDVQRLVRHIADLRKDAKTIEDTFESQGDYNREGYRVDWRREEADTLEEFILPNAQAHTPRTKEQ